MLKYLRMFPTFVPKALKLMPTINRHFKHLEKYPVQKRYKIYRDFVNSLMKHTFHVVVKVFNIENAPKQGMYVPNHIAAIDPVMLISVFENHFFFVGKKEAQKYPLVGKVMHNINSIFLDRKSLRDGVKMINQASLFLKENTNSNLVIFPEGSRTKDMVNFTINDFHSGCFKIALNTHIDIVPVCMFGTQNILNQKVHKKNYCVIIKILKPIKYEQYKNLTTEQIGTIAREMIVSNMDDVKKEYEKWDNFYNSTNYIKQR